MCLFDYRASFNFSGASMFGVLRVTSLARGHLWSNKLSIMNERKRVIYFFSNGCEPSKRGMDEMAASMEI